MIHFPKSLLRRAVYAYTLLPVLIFCFGWFQWYVSFPIGLLGLFGFIRFFRKGDTVTYSNKDIRQLAIALGIILIIVAFSGVAAHFGIGAQQGDYGKHNAILRDLILNDWPVVYQLPDGSPALLVYYIGYYLPAALVGKIFCSFGAAVLFQTLYNIGALLLACLLLFEFLRKVRWHYAFVFFFLSGADFVGQLLLNGIPAGNTNMERFLPDLPLLSYNWPISTIFWTPQHTIMMMMVVLTLLLDLREKQPYPLRHMPGLLLTSVFSFIGILPFVAYALWRTIRQKTLRIFDFVWCIIGCLPIGCFYLLGSNQGEFSWIVSRETVFTLWPQIVIFALLEFGLMMIAIARYRRSPLWVITLCTLVFFLFPVYGIYNDLGMRASMPALCVLAVLVVHYGVRHPKRTASRFLVVFFCLGLFTGFNWFSYSLQKFGQEYNTYTSIVNVPPEYLPQYVAVDYKSSIFYRIVLQKEKEH